MHEFAVPTLGLSRIPFKEYDPPQPDEQPNDGENNAIDANDPEDPDGSDSDKSDLDT